MAAHTPGPWGIKGYIEVWIMAGHLHVATIPRAHDGDWSEANARLIAAAPALLEALEGLSKYEGHHAYCGHAPDYDKPCVCGFNDAEVIARAAISLAKGEAK